jgi:uncharacterized FlaG/YvyC family protein
MEVSSLNSLQLAPRPDRSGEQRAEALAEKRREATAREVARAEEGRERAADRLADVREAVARVLGANTRLSIARSETSLDFVYRAIDIDTGEVVNEWPQDTFVELVRGVSEDVRIDANARDGMGTMLDRVA